VTTRLQGLTGATLPSAPTVCHDCVWWQSKPGKRTSKQRWIDKAEDDWGAWGTLYLDDDGRVLGAMQYGPSELFPRAEDLPAGPASDDAALVTCAYLVEGSAQWVMQSLFLAAIADVKERGGKALEAFAYRYPEGESAEERFLVHRTVFPADFLADFGFRPVRRLGRVELARLELGGLLAEPERKREKLARQVRELLEPELAPAPRRP
jgi:hypothetical protein